MSTTYNLPAPSNEVSLYLTCWFLDTYYAGIIHGSQRPVEKLFRNMAYLALVGQDFQIPELAYKAMASSCSINLQSMQKELRREAKVIYEWLMSGEITASKVGEN